MKMEYVIKQLGISLASIVGSNARFPVRRIFLRRAQLRRAPEGDGGDGRDSRFLHQIGARSGAAERRPERRAALSADDEQLPLGKRNGRLVGTGGSRFRRAKATSTFWGYAIGLDMSARDLHRWARTRAALDLRKDFDQSAPWGDHPASRSGTRPRASLWLKVQRRVPPSSDIDQMIWRCPSRSLPSQYYTSKPAISS